VWGEGAQPSAQGAHHSTHTQLLLCPTMQLTSSPEKEGQVVGGCKVVDARPAATEEARASQRLRHQTSGRGQLRGYAQDCWSR
jgi:hypothetical protein